MIKVELTRDTIVRLEKGTVLEVSDSEASRLIAFGNAVKAEEKKVAKRTAKKVR